MNAKEFNSVIRNTPVWVPVFEVVNVPSWAEYYGIRKGDRVYYSVQIEGVYHESGRGFNLGPSSLKFIEYKMVGDELL